MTRRPTALAATLLVAAATLGGCALVYDVREQSEVRQCRQLPDKTDRELCDQRLRDTRRAFEKRQAEQARQDAPAIKPVAPPDARPAGLCFRRAATGELVCPN